MIVEGLLTTLDAAGKLNLAPMGPIVVEPIIHGNFQQLILRPFQPSTTFNNLSATRCGVFHIVDQIDVIARAAIAQLSEIPPVHPATCIDGFVLQDCCRWFELTIDSIDASTARSRMPATVVHTQERRPFWGFNRARHAVLEAAIIATRVHMMDWQEIESAFQFLAPAVEKTGGTTEKDSFAMLQQFVWSKKDAAA